MNCRSQNGCATIEDDSRGPRHTAGRHLGFDLLFRTLFRSRDSPLLTQATSIAPSGSESRQAHEIHTTFPRKSASRPECPAPGRRTRECSFSSVVSLLLVGGPTGRTDSAVGGRDRDLRNCRAALRFNSKAPGAFGTLSTLSDRCLYVADIDASTRSHRSRTRDRQRICCRSSHPVAFANSSALERRGVGDAG